MDAYLWLLRVAGGAALLLTVSSLLLNAVRHRSKVHEVYTASLPPTLSVLPQFLPASSRNLHVRELEALAGALIEVDAGTAEERRTILRSISALPIHDPTAEAYETLATELLEGEEDGELSVVREASADSLRKQAEPLMATAICDFALRAAEVAVSETEAIPAHGRAPARWVERHGDGVRPGTARVSIFIPVLGLVPHPRLLETPEIDWSGRLVTTTVPDEDLLHLREAAAQLKDAVLGSGYSARSIVALYRGLVQARNPAQARTLPDPG